MSDTPLKLATPLVAVALERGDETVELTVQTDNRDAIAWDLGRGRRNYPASTDAPILWLTFLAWNALRRTGEQVGKFEEFLQVCISVRALKRDGTPLADEDLDPESEDIAAGPTRAAVELD